VKPTRDDIKLLPYRGELTAEMAARGIAAAKRNAERLLKDANHLFEAGSYATACSLAILSIEESGKVSILREIFAAPTDQARKDAWRRYRDHKSKNAQWILMDLFRKGARKLAELKSIFDPKSAHPLLMDQIKQLGIYTDCFSSRSWSEPEKVIDENITGETLLVAAVLLPKDEVTTRELELWKAHVGPVWGTPAMFDASLEFHRALIAEGLSEKRIEDYERFFGINPTSADNMH
jgi:AbiV family abortive infection protein